MKRVLAACLVFLLLFVISESSGESEDRYTAMTSVRFHLRDTPDGRKLAEVPKGERIRIAEWAEDWCLARYNGVTGYCKTEWLYMFISLDPRLYPLPRVRCSPTGYTVMKEDTWIQAGKFDGVFISPGEKVCVSYISDGLCKLPVWRDEQELAAGTGDYYPFTGWENAEPGDIIGGFTTFYSERQGKRHPASREKNIKTGCDRINNRVVAAGDKFSFNAVCGPYLKSNGYALAPNISRMGEGYGGGICQVTTTLYNAVLTLPLKIEEWSIHKYTGISYVPQFFDAAVGRHSDFVFSNTLPYPIRILATAGNGIINVFIMRAEYDAK